MAAGTRLFASTDGGETWSVRAALHDPIFGMSFTSADDGWAVTSTALLHTFDGGRTWASVAAPISSGFQRVDFRSPDDGWLSSSDRLLATTDGGQTWVARTTPCRIGEETTGGFFHFVSVGTGFDLCPEQPSGGQQLKNLYRTDDGGAHWSLVAGAYVSGTPPPRGMGETPSSGYASDLFFLDADHGWITENRGTLWATNDGGLTWDYDEFFSPEAYQSAVAFTADRHGYVLASTPFVNSDYLPDVPAVYVTDDGAATWHLSAIGDFTTPVPDQTITRRGFGLCC